MSFSKFKRQKVSQRTTPVTIAAAPSQLSPAQNDISPQVHYGHVQREKRPRLMDQNETHPFCPLSQGVKDGQNLQEEQREHVSAHTRSQDGRTRLLERDIIPAKQSSMSFSAAPDDLGICEFKLGIFCCAPTPKFLCAAFIASLLSSSCTDRSLADSQSAPLWEHRLRSVIDSYSSPRSIDRNFDQYIGNFITTYPVIIFPPRTMAGHIRKIKPLLFLAITSVAPISICPSDRHR